MKKLNWPVICIGFCCVLWVSVMVVSLVVGVFNHEARIRQLEHRPHITVWTYLTAEDIATLQADGAKEVILRGWAELEEIDWIAWEDTTLAEEE